MHERRASEPKSSSIGLTVADFNEACTEIVGSGGILPGRLLGYSEGPEVGNR